MRISAIVPALVLVSLFSLSLEVNAHCQVPCGIYDDDARIAAIKEDATTIVKAIKNISQLSGQHGAKSQNQLVRWVTTKDAHASHVIETVSEYFLAQRVKTARSSANVSEDDYVNRLKVCHGLIVAAMKAKQSADPSAVAALETAVDKFADKFHQATH